MVKAGSVWINQIFLLLSFSWAHMRHWDTADETSVGALESLSQTQIVPGGSDITPCPPLCPIAVGRGAWRTPKSRTSFLRKTQKSSSRIFAKLDMAALALFILWVFFLWKRNPHYHFIMKWRYYPSPIRHEMGGQMRWWPSRRCLTVESSPMR